MKRTDFDFLSKMTSLRVSEIIVSQDWGKLPGIELAGINQLIKKEPDTELTSKVTNSVFITMTKLE